MRQAQNTKEELTNLYKNMNCTNMISNTETQHYTTNDILRNTALALLKISFAILLTFILIALIFQYNVDEADMELPISKELYVGSIEDTVALNIIDTTKVPKINLIASSGVKIPFYRKKYFRIIIQPDPNAPLTQLYKYLTTPKPH